MKLSMEVNSLRRCCLISSKAEVSSCSVAILDKEKENLDKESWKLKFKVRSVEWNGGECGFGWSIYICIYKRKRRLRLEELGKLGKFGVKLESKSSCSCSDSNMVWAAWNGILAKTSVPGNIIQVRSFESWLPHVGHTSFTKGLDSGPAISFIIDSKGDGTLVLVVRAIFLRDVSASLFPFLTLSFSTSWCRAKRRCSASVSSSIKLCMVSSILEYSIRLPT